MILSNYTPNLNDSRVIKSITRALEFSNTHLNSVFPFQLHINDRRRHFGNSSIQPLACWLEANLLVDQCSGYEVGKRSKSYRINLSGNNKLISMIGGQNTYHTDIIRKKYEQELFMNKPFEYTDKSNRLWHPLQFERREDKKIIMPLSEGWYDYDISTALPSMYLNKHKQLMNLRGFTNSYVIQCLEELPAISYYIKNKEKVRYELAQKFNVDVEVMKKLITAVFNNARLNAHSSCAIFRQFGQDAVKTTLFSMDEFIQGLKKDMRKFWRTTWNWYNKDRQVNGLPPVKKSVFYFILEREVLHEVNNFLMSSNQVSNFLLEHDGFRSKGKVNKDSLSSFVDSSTGFRLDWS